MVGIPTLFFCILAVSVSCIEGDVKPEKRIVGGEEANPNEFPHHLYLVIKAGGDARICGGSLLSTEWVLTSASCVHKPEPGLNEIIAGRHRGTENNVVDPSERVSIGKEVFVHPCFILDPLLYNDIALIKLATPFTLNDKVKTIQIDETDRAKPDTQTTAIGWGISEGNGPSSKFPRVLKKTTIQLPGAGQCLALVAGSKPEIQQCANGKDNICGQDHGGPLLCEDGGVNYVCGISSATGGGFSDSSMFTRVSHYRNWIKKVMATGCNNEMDCVDAEALPGLPPKTPVEKCVDVIPDAKTDTTPDTFSGKDAKTDTTTDTFGGKDANYTDSRATTLYGQVLYELFVPMISISFFRIYETNLY